MTSGSSMSRFSARRYTLSLPPHLGQVSMSMAKTRFNRCIQDRGARGWSCALELASRHDVFTLLAVRGEHTVQAGEVQTRTRHQCGQAGHQVEWVEHDMCGAVAKRLFEFVDVLATRIGGEALVGDGGDGESGLVDEVCGDRAVHHTQDPAQYLRLGGEQEAQRVGEGQHPLANRLLGKDMIDQMRGALDHPPSATRGAEPAALTAEGNQVLVAASVAIDAQKAVLEQAALQVVIELLFDERGR